MKGRRNYKDIWSLQGINIFNVCYCYYYYYYFYFRLMPYLLGLFHWGACRMSKLGAISKRKSCKINRIEWEMHAMSSFGLSFVSAWSVCTRIYCPFIAPKSSDSVQWMGSGYACIHSQKENPKLDITHIISFLTWPPIYSQCTRPSEIIVTNKASIKRQINRLSRDI